MQHWIKFYEAVTKPLPVASALFLFLSTSFLLFAPDAALTKLGLSRVIANYRWAVGLSFVIALTWLVVTSVLWIGNRLYRRMLQWQMIHRDGTRVVKAISQMDSKEREIIGYLLAKNQRMFTNTPDGGYANTLISKGIIILALRPGQAFSNETPFEVPEHIWNVLLKYKAEFPYVAREPNQGGPYPWRIPWSAR